MKSIQHLPTNEQEEKGSAESLDEPLTNRAFPGNRPPRRTYRDRRRDRQRRAAAARGTRQNGRDLRLSVQCLLLETRHYKLGNQFGLVFLDLPIGIENPVQRLYAVRANMNALKGSFQPVLALGLLAAMGSGPKALQDVLLDALARNASGVMTNVPGPQQPLYLAGAAIKSLMFWVPQSGDIGMGVSIISYDGAVQFGIITDAGLCPDPDARQRALRRASSRSSC